MAMQSELGRFVSVCDDYITPYADYRIREYASGAIKATISGKLGTVEVWGGLSAKEVWYIERATKDEKLITGHWYTSVPRDWMLSYHLDAGHRPMHLCRALEEAFACASVQTKLPCFEGRGE